MSRPENLLRIFALLAVSHTAMTVLVIYLLVTR